MNLSGHPDINCTVLEGKERKIFYGDHVHYSKFLKIIICIKDEKPVSKRRNVSQKSPRFKKNK